MSKLHVSLPSPALIVAIAALFIALSGVAVGLPGKNNVDKGDIKKNAVTTKKIKDDSVTAAKLANNAVTGSKLANGAVGIVMRQGPPTTINDGQAKQVEANCNPGERATGGGVFNESQVGTLVLTSSYPTPNPTSPPSTGDGKTPTGWRVWLKNNTPGSNYTVNGYVICTS